MRLPLVRAVVVAFALSVLAHASAFAQAWPARPLRLIVPFPADGPTDLVGRAAAEIRWGEAIRKAGIKAE